MFRGHGTYEEGEELKASVAGLCERVSKLVLVRALRWRYTGEVGDVVIGRVVEVQQKRWKVDVNSRLDAVLMLSSVNLPGGELVSTPPRFIYLTNSIENLRCLS
jgi:exosome complex component RRP4